MEKQMLNGNVRKIQEDRDDESGVCAERPAAEARRKKQLLPNVIFSESKDTIPHAWMGRRRNRRARPTLFWGFVEIDQITSTWSFCPSTRRRSSWIQYSGTVVCFTIRVFSALVNSSMAELFAMRRRFQEEISVLPGSFLSRDSLIQHYKTTCCYQTTSPSTSTTLDAPTTCTPSSNQDWFRVEKMSSKRRQTVFFTAVNPFFAHIHKQRDYDVTKPRSAAHKQNWKTHLNTVYWEYLKVALKKGLAFYQTRSDAIIHHNSLPAACIEKVVVMNSE